MLRILWTGCAWTESVQKMICDRAEATDQSGPRPGPGPVQSSNSKCEWSVRNKVRFSGLFRDLAQPMEWCRLQPKGGGIWPEVWLECHQTGLTMGQFTSPNSGWLQCWSCRIIASYQYPCCRVFIQSNLISSPLFILTHHAKSTGWIATHAMHFTSLICHCHFSPPPWQCNNSPLVALPACQAQLLSCPSC